MKVNNTKIPLWKQKRGKAYKLIRHISPVNITMLITEGTVIIYFYYMVLLSRTHDRFVQTRARWATFSLECHKENNCMSIFVMKTTRQSCQTCGAAKEDVWLSPSGQEKKRACWRGSRGTEQCSASSCISSLALHLMLGWSCSLHLVLSARLFHSFNPLHTMSLIMLSLYVWKASE